MKIDRLIGILSILLQQDKVTAPRLAEKFEVSRRTINRDIEDLCKAGIPIVTVQGKHGGISIMENYKIDRTLLTSSEMQSILTGLRSLDSISGNRQYQQLMDKLSAGSNSMISADQHIAIDLSSYYKQSLAPKIGQIRMAMEQSRKIRFTYYSYKGRDMREIEPYLLVFQWSSWYVWGYCFKRNDYRLFKLNRLLDLEILQETFASRNPPPYDISIEKAFPPQMKVTALFHRDARWQLIEEFGIESFTEQEDGTLLFTFDFTDKENLFSWLLSFGAKVQLLEPEELCSELGKIACEISEKYKT